MRLSRVLVPLFAVLFATGAGGCGDAAGVGGLAVSWILGGPGCEDAGVSTIRLRLLEGNSDVLEPAPTADCDQGYAGLDVVDVPAGRFTMLLEGLNEDGHADFEDRVEHVRIRENDTTTLGPVVLALRPSSLRLRWGFRDQLTCGSSGVLKVQATLIDDMGNEVATPAPFLCEIPLTAENPEGGVLLTDLPARRTLSILLYGLNVDGVAVQFGYGEVDTAPGDTAAAAVWLDTCGVDAPCL